MTEIHIDKILVQALPKDVARKINEIQSALIDLIGKVGTLMTAVDDLRTQVERTTSLEQSAITMIQGLAQQIQDVAGDEVAVQDLASQLSSNADALAAALAANTPAATVDGETPPDSPDTSVTGDATPGGGTSPADVKV